MSFKTFNFDFYQCEVLSSQTNSQLISINEVFGRFKTKSDSETENTVREIKGYSYELRIIEQTDYGFRGVIGKYRESNLPHAAIPGGGERELDLQENEHLIEKSYFKFFSDYSLLILQRNRLAISSETFSNYLSIDGYTVSLNPIIAPDDLHRLMRNDVKLRSLQVRVARPTNPELFRNLEHDFTNSIVASLNGTNASTVNLELRGEGRSSNPEKKFLNDRFKRAMLELTNKFPVKKAKLQLEEPNGDTHPLDLISTRLYHSQRLSIDGRYPFPSDIWNALREAREEKEEEIISYFGSLTEQRIA
ncbi:hypothetical protein DSLASN_01530 [Desulfoluna limicola]|uniref:Uncharacterized protein n=1 Tax=Desulfoluna limicola TaxID=2810562 RepID=A0ABM7PBI5_9BACT|nr:DUF6731 family protein [Desulfoluna limicola]BCS94521.1 hypothetical protein DSLASN_01530 [Desulfoluna limicola]